MATYYLVAWTALVGTMAGTVSATALGAGAVTTPSLEASPSPQGRASSPTDVLTDSWFANNGYLPDHTCRAIDHENVQQTGFNQSGK